MIMSPPSYIHLRQHLARALSFLLVAGHLALQAQAQSVRPGVPAGDGAGRDATPARKTGVFVENRAGKTFDAKVEILEDLISARLAGEGFALISRDAATRGLRDYTQGGRSWPTGLDKELESSTSALRLAQNLGADYILLASITTYGKDKRAYEGNGIKTTNILHTLRVTSRIIDTAHGGAIRGVHAMASKNIRISEGLQTDSDSLLDELLDDAAAQVAAELARIGKSEPKGLALTVAGGNAVEFDLNCFFVDLYEKPILVSGLVVTKDQVLLKSPQPAEVQPFDVTVELNGVVIGSAPGKFLVRPGLHKIRLSREGIRTWERTIDLTAGQKLRVGLQMSDEAYARWKAGYERWKDNVAFVEELKNKARLTEAQARLIEGYAKFWHESLCRIDYRVDTKENFQNYSGGHAPIPVLIPAAVPAAPVSPASPPPPNPQPLNNSPESTQGTPSASVAPVTDTLVVNSKPTPAPATQPVTTPAASATTTTTPTLVVHPELDAYTKDLVSRINRNTTSTQNKPAPTVPASEPAPSPAP